MGEPDFQRSEGVHHLLARALGRDARSRERGADSRKTADEIRVDLGGVAVCFVDVGGEGDGPIAVDADDGGGAAGGGQLGDLLQWDPSTLRRDDTQATEHGEVLPRVFGQPHTHFDLLIVGLQSLSLFTEEGRSQLPRQVARAESEEACVIAQGQSQLHFADIEVVVDLTDAAVAGHVLANVGDQVRELLGIVGANPQFDVGTYRPGFSGPHPQGGRSLDAADGRTQCGDHLLGFAQSTILSFLRGHQLHGELPGSRRIRGLIATLVVHQRAQRRDHPLHLGLRPRQRFQLLQPRECDVFGRTRRHLQVHHQSFRVGGLDEDEGNDARADQSCGQREQRDHQAMNEVAPTQGDIEVVAVDSLETVLEKLGSPSVESFEESTQGARPTGRRGRRDARVPEVAGQDQ